MEKSSILLKLCYKFSKKYMSSYITSIAKPILFGIIGIFLLYLIKIDTKFVILSLLSIPCMCYAFWKGYVITYALIPCADNFLKNNSLPFEHFIPKVKKQEKTFAGYVCFIAILSIFLYIPSVLYTVFCIAYDILLRIPPSIFHVTYVAHSVHPVPFNGDIGSLPEYITLIDGAFLINTLLIAPFLNYALCAFYYKKENENYFKLFWNCYKKLNVFGLFIAVVVTWFSYKQIVPYLIVALFLNPFIYSLNAFWYSTRLKK